MEALGAFDFVAAAPAGSPLHLLEVTRLEEGGLEVRVPGRPRIVPELPVPVRSALRDRGFASDDPADPTKPWVHAVADARSAVDLVQSLLTEVFGEKPDADLDMSHGSHRAEREAQQRLTAVRAHIEKVMAAMAGRPADQDADGDYVLPRGDVLVTVAPRVVPGGPVVVRVFTITNVAVNVTRSSASSSRG